MIRRASVSPVLKPLHARTEALSLAASVFSRLIVLPTPPQWVITVFHTRSQPVRMASRLKMASVSSRRDHLAHLVTSPGALTVTLSRNLFVPQRVLWMVTVVLLESTLTASFSAHALKSLSCDMGLIVEAARRLNQFPDGPSLIPCFLPLSYVVLLMRCWTRRQFETLRSQLPIARLVHYPCPIFFYSLA